MWAPLLGALLAFWLTLLIAVTVGRTRWLVCTRGSTFTLTPVVMLATFGLAFLCDRELCSTIEHPRAPPRTRTASVVGIEWTTTVPATLFGALSVQAFMQVTMSPGSTRKLFVAPMLMVHVCTLLYYLVGETLAPACVVTTRWGTEEKPLHYALWWVSMSAQLLTINGLEHTLRSQASAIANLKGHGGGGASAAAAPSLADPAERQAVRRCALALACVPVMLLLTLYVDVLHGPLPMIAGVFAAFYAALVLGIAAPLSACSEHALAASAAPSARSIAFRCRAVAAYLLCVWHVFPLVWVLALVGALSHESARIGYVVADVLAKFLPVTLYVTAVLSS